MWKLTLPSGKIIEVNSELNLRASLRDYRAEIYHDTMLPIHCRGLGTCGTCAVRIEGEVTPPTKVERWRFNFPPHKNSLEKGLRLACQCKPLSDLKIIKETGKWGQGGSLGSESY
jgi:ferredoxin